MCVLKCDPRIGTSLRIHSFSLTWEVHPCGAGCLITFALKMRKVMF